MPNHIAPELIINSTLYTLLAFSVVTWTMILFKILQLVKINLYNRRFNSEFWNTDDFDQALALPEAVFRGPAARIARAGLGWLKESRQLLVKKLKNRGKLAELLEHALIKQMQDEQRSMERGLSLLASIGSTSPFVGLFGTVLGIMHAMHQITQSGKTSLDVVAGPIGDALIATAIGIAVAVPAVLAYNFFLRRIKQQRTNLENFVAEFMYAALETEGNSDGL